MVTVTHVASAESYMEFLARIHRADVLDGVGRHRPGDCETCDSIPDKVANDGVRPANLPTFSQCMGVTKKGVQCKAIVEGQFCWMHAPKEA